MIKELIKLADHLDHIGLAKEADNVDSIIKKATAGEQIKKLLSDFEKGYSDLTLKEKEYSNSRTALKQKMDKFHKYMWLYMRKAYSDRGLDDRGLREEVVEYLFQFYSSDGNMSKEEAESMAEYMFDLVYSRDRQRKFFKTKCFD